MGSSIDGMFSQSYFSDPTISDCWEKHSINALTIKKWYQSYFSYFSNLSSRAGQEKHSIKSLTSYAGTQSLFSNIFTVAKAR